MRGFVALSWSTDDPVGVRTGRILRELAVAEGWRAIESRDASWVGVRGPNPPGVYSPRTGTLIIGEVFNHPDAVARAAEGDTDLDVATWYSRNRWGRYVILFRCPNGAVRSVFRDPSGSLAVHGWCARGVQIFASSLFEGLIAAAPPDIGFDWDRVRALAERPFDLAGDPPLTGITTVQPGHLGEIGGRSTPVWAAAAIAAAPTRRAAEARFNLRQTLDLCVSALSGRGAVGMEWRPRLGDRRRRPERGREPYSFWPEHPGPPC